MAYGLLVKPASGPWDSIVSPSTQGWLPTGKQTLSHAFAFDNQSKKDGLRLLVCLGRWAPGIRESMRGEGGEAQ